MSINKSDLKSMGFDVITNSGVQELVHLNIKNGGLGLNPKRITRKQRRAEERKNKQS
jgi:hypothetical protein